MHLYIHTHIMFMCMYEDMSALKGAPLSDMRALTSVACARIVSTCAHAQRALYWVLCARHDRLSCSCWSHPRSVLLVSSSSCWLLVVGVLSCWLLVASSSSWGLGRQGGVWFGWKKKGLSLSPCFEVSLFDHNVHLAVHVVSTSSRLRKQTAWCTVCMYRFAMHRCPNRETDTKLACADPLRSPVEELELHARGGA